MARYYYKRYSAKPQYSKDNQTSSMYFTYDRLPLGDVYMCNITNPALETSMIRESLLCDVDTGYYAASSAQHISNDTYLQQWMYLVICSPTEAWAVNGNLYSVSAAHNQIDGVRLLSKYTITPTYVAGELVEEIIAEDGTYPNDGYNAADGYYYVKDRMAIQFFTRINGAWVDTHPSARIGGAWTELDIRPRVSGAWIG